MKRSSSNQPTETMAAACELEERIGLGVLRGVARAVDQAELVQNAGNSAVAAIQDLAANASGSELVARAYRLRAFARQALAAIAELQLEAGRLEAYASVKEATEGEDGRE